MVACLLVGLATASAQTATARLDSAVMLIGDPNRLVVGVEGLPAGTAFTVDWSPLDTVAALRPTGDEQRVSTDAGLRAALPFSVYDSVGLLLPPLAAYAGGDTLYTNDVALLVDFPPTEGTLNDYRGIRRESARLSDYLPWIIGGVALALAVALAFWLLARARREPAAQPTPPPPTPPHEVALADLRVLRQRADLDDKAYYSRLDHILRRYLEDRYGVPALERTSGEVTALLRDRDLPDVAELSDLLSQVDLVKFARAELPAARRAAAVDRVEAFVLATRPAPVVVEREGAAVIVDDAGRP